MKKKGFTLLEIVVSLAVIAIIVTIVATSFSNLNKIEALNTEVDTVLSMIERARIRTVSSENGFQYGMHFASTSVVLFVGTSYVAGSSTNETENFNSNVKIKSINLTGGVANVYFSKLSGKPNATGTVVFSLNSNASTTKTITLYNTGQSDAK